MHSPIQELFMILAINLILASPFLAYLLERRGFFGEQTVVVTVAQALAIPLAAVSAGAAAIHLAGLEAELAFGSELALLFAAGVVFQALWALRWLRRPSPRLAMLAIVVNLGLFATWLLSRTIGLPFGPFAGIREVAGVSDSFAAMFEGTLVVGLVAQLWRPVRRALETHVLAPDAASLAVMMALVTVTLLALFGVVTGGVPVVPAAT